MEYKNIKEDFFYETSASSLNYTIYDGDTAIYFGKAVKSPVEDVLRINVAQRVRDYLSTDMPDFRDFDGVVVPHPDALKVFTLRGEYGDVLGEYEVLLDYDEPYNGNNAAYNDPINTHADIRQKIFITNCKTEMGYPDIGNYLIDFHITWDKTFVFGGGAGTFTACYTANTPTNVSASRRPEWVTSIEGTGFAKTGCVTITYKYNSGDTRSDYFIMYYMNGGSREEYYVDIKQFTEDIPVSPDGIPQPNEIWINKEAYTTDNIWIGWIVYPDHDGADSALVRSIYGWGEWWDVLNSQITVVETDTYKILRFPFEIRNFDTAKISNKVKDLTSIVYPPSMWGYRPMWRYADSQPQLIPVYYDDTVRYTVNDTLTSVTYTFSEEWREWYIKHYGRQNIETAPYLKIPDGAYMRCRELKSLTLPEITTGNKSYLGEACFRFCTSLESLYIPDGYSSLSPVCFGNCTSLVNVSLSNNVRDFSVKYGYTPFHDCTSLTEVTYRGTMEEFNTTTGKISNRPLTIHCTDGDVEFIP